MDTACDAPKNSVIPLKLTHVDRYLHGPVPGSGETGVNQKEIPLILNQLRIEVAKWGTGSNLPRQDSKTLVSPGAAVLALGELTPGGALMKGFREESLGRRFFFFNIYFAN